MNLKINVSYADIRNYSGNPSGLAEHYRTIFLKTFFGWFVVNILIITLLFTGRFKPIISYSEDLFHALLSLFGAIMGFWLVTCFFCLIKAIHFKSKASKKSPLR